MTTTAIKNKEQENMIIPISAVMVVEGNLYQVMGEDEMLTLYDAHIQVLIDGDVYYHKHIFKGYVEDPDGFKHPNYNAKSDANAFCAKVADRGTINTNHWVCVGNLSECPVPLESLEAAWSDNSDHFKCFENYITGR